MFDCGTCLEGRQVDGIEVIPPFPLEMRAGWHCAFLPEEEWTACTLPDSLGPVRVAELGVCPGGLARRPTVVACAEAYTAFDKGSLAAFAPAADGALLDGLMVLQRAIAQHQAEAMAEIKRKSRG